MQRAASNFRLVYLFQTALESHKGHIKPEVSGMTKKRRNNCRSEAKRRNQGLKKPFSSFVRSNQEKWRESWKLGEEERTNKCKSCILFTISEVFLSAYKGNCLHFENLACSQQIECLSAVICSLYRSSFACKQAVLFFTWFSTSLTK